MAQTREYVAWKAMKQRCYYVKSKSYPDYGGRGIRVCNEWLHDYAKFLENIGPKPTPFHTLERINNAKNYEPGNVRWATRREQNNNTRKNRFITLNGETKTLTKWAADLGIPLTTFWRRVGDGSVYSGGVPSRP